MKATREEIDMLDALGEPHTMENVLLVRETIASCRLDGDTQCGWECPACMATTNVTEKHCCKCGKDRP